MRMNEFRAIVRAIELVKAERAELSRRGPRFLVVHRFWQPETICTPGEAIAEVQMMHRRKAFSVPLSTRLLLLFDYLARHKGMPQSASLIAAGLSVDPFSQEHGFYANAEETLSKDLSRTAVKQQIVRLRAALRSAFRKAGLNIDPSRVVISTETEMNEVRYRLKAAVEWRHLEF
jgi:hypothetical protein